MVLHMCRGGRVEDEDGAARQEEKTDGCSYRGHAEDWYDRKDAGIEGDGGARVMNVYR